MQKLTQSFGINPGSFSNVLLNCSEKILNCKNVLQNQIFSIPGALGLGAVTTAAGNLNKNLDDAVGSVANAETGIVNLVGNLLNTKDTSINNQSQESDTKNKNTDTSTIKDLLTDIIDTTTSTHKPTDTADPILSSLKSLDVPGTVSEVTNYFFNKENDNKNKTKINSPEVENNDSNTKKIKEAALISTDNLGKRGKTNVKEFSNNSIISNFKTVASKPTDTTDPILSSLKSLDVPGTVSEVTNYFFNKENDNKNKTKINSPEVENNDSNTKKIKEAALISTDNLGKRGKTNVKEFSNNSIISNFKTVASKPTDTTDPILSSLKSLDVPGTVSDVTNYFFNKENDNKNKTKINSPEVENNDSNTKKIKEAALISTDNLGKRGKTNVKEFSNNSIISNFKTDASKPTDTTDPILSSLKSLDVPGTVSKVTNYFFNEENNVNKTKISAPEVENNDSNTQKRIEAALISTDKLRKRNKKKVKEFSNNSVISNFQTDASTTSKISNDNPKTTKFKVSKTDVLNEKLDEFHTPIDTIFAKEYINKTLHSPSIVKDVFPKTDDTNFSKQVNVPSPHTLTELEIDKKSDPIALNTRKTFVVQPRDIVARPKIPTANDAAKQYYAKDCCKVVKLNEIFGTSSSNAASYLDEIYKNTANVVTATETSIPSIFNTGISTITSALQSAPEKGDSEVSTLGTKDTIRATSKNNSSEGNKSTEEANVDNVDQVSPRNDEDIILSPNNPFKSIKGHVNENIKDHQNHKSLEFQTKEQNFLGHLPEVTKIGKNILDTNHHSDTNPTKTLSLSTPIANEPIERNTIKPTEDQKPFAFISQLPEVPKTIGKNILDKNHHSDTNPTKTLSLSTPIANESLEHNTDKSHLQELPKTVTENKSIQDGETGTMTAENKSSEGIGLTGVGQGIQKSVGETLRNVPSDNVDETLTSCLGTVTDCFDSLFPTSDQKQTVTQLNTKDDNKNIHEKVVPPLPKVLKTVPESISVRDHETGTASSNTPIECNNSIGRVDKSITKTVEDKLTNGPSSNINNTVASSSPTVEIGNSTSSPKASAKSDTHSKSTPLPVVNEFQNKIVQPTDSPTVNTNAPKIKSKTDIFSNVEHFAVKNILPKIDEPNSTLSKVHPTAIEAHNTLPTVTNSSKPEHEINSSKTPQSNVKISTPERLSKGQKSPKTNQNSSLFGGVSDFANNLVSEGVDLFSTSDKK